MSFKLARRHKDFKSSFKVMALNVKNPERNCLTDGQIYDATWDDLDVFRYVKVWISKEKRALRLYWHCFKII